MTAYFFLEPANYAADIEDIHRVRNAVFVEEQRIAAELEFDELDPVCHHFIVRDHQHQAIATARLTPEGRIGRMAVLKPWRGQGIGTLLLAALSEKARSLGLTQLVAGAQIAALSFYQKSGFEPSGAPYQEAGIAHQTVSLTLSAQPEHTASRRIAALPPAVEPSRFDHPTVYIAALQQLAQLTRRNLYLVTRSLERGIYGRDEVVEALKQLALRSRNGGVQIIIQECENLRGQSHPLIDLAQRLPSSFTLRTPTEAEDRQNLTAYAFNDAGGYVFCPQADRSEGHWSPNAPARNRQLQGEFDGVWQRSRLCTEFRALAL